jgi:hypothetical protein
MLVIQREFKTKLQGKWESYEDVERLIEQYKKKEVKYEEVSKKYS